MQMPCLWLVMNVYHCGLYTYTIITPRSSLRLHKALHPPERKKKRKTWTTFMLVQVKKKERGGMEDAWIPLRIYISVAPGHDPSDGPSNYHETLCLHLQNECVRHAITIARAPHTPSEESSKQSEVWVRWVNEWSEQESPPWFYKIQKTLPSTAKQELATTLIDSFRRSIGEYDSASHSKSKVWRENFEITLMHTLSHEP